MKRTIKVGKMSNRLMDIFQNRPIFRSLLKRWRKIGKKSGFSEEDDVLASE
jgi:hypothetical protein